MSLQGLAYRERQPPEGSGRNWLSTYLVGYRRKWYLRARKRHTLPLRVPR